MFRAQVMPRTNTRLGQAQEDMENGETLFPQGISGLCHRVPVSCLPCLL